ncbi:ATP-binding protein [Nocardioides sp. CN2-186]|uniref:sensor histidine kinase n=1 Tax=Nocardioides tweenelious TaxID=3156607 RepID=UPI0032B3F558
MGVKARVARGAVVSAVVVAVVVDATAERYAVANAAYLGVMVGASLAAWLGFARSVLEDRTVPLLIAAGISASALGEVLWALVDAAGGDTDVSVADPAWFAGYIFLCGAVWVVLRESRPDGQATFEYVLDALTIVSVSILVFWRMSVGEIVADPTQSPFVRLVWAAYPILDAVLLALVVRALLSRSARAAIDGWFAVGVCLWLAADIAYLQTSTSDTADTLMEAAWMVAPVLIARSAWRTRPVVPTAPRAGAVGGWVVPMMIAVCPLLIPPGLELVADLRGRPDHPFQLLIGMAAVITLAFVRTGRLIRSEQRAQRESEVARDAALAASETKSVFLANMSHEIRTPLTSILASGELLDDTDLDPVQRKLLERQHHSGVRLMSLVERILDFSRIEAGEAVLDRVDVDVRALVADLADTFRPRATQAGVRFDIEIDPGVPPLVVGDPIRVFQVVSNLVDNALKFTEAGSVRLSVRPGHGDLVVFRVTDTGIGISEADQASVFESFRQVDGSTTRRFGGSGLGLAICRELTEQMGGTIEVESELGVGSSFVASIPLPSPVAVGG